MSGLRDAHRGYLYQDLTAAIALAELLVSARGSVTVDTKEFEGDSFDDLTVRSAGVRVSRQLKATDSSTRELVEQDFKWGSSSVNLRDLLAAYLGLQKEVSTEMRLAVRWHQPTDATFLGYLAEIQVPAPSIPGAATHRYRLNAAAIWPPGGTPAWPILAGASRDDLVEFCDHFVVETDLPSCSHDLRNPGFLETVLLNLLTEQVGIGIYPNANRFPADVAARLIVLATRARANSETLSVDQVARAVALQRDYGCVTQDFPVREKHQVPREDVQAALMAAISDTRVVALVGAPGSGKSWELTKLVSALRDDGRIVARHLCYLDPSDHLASRRVTIDVMCGNLVAELVEAMPQLADTKTKRYAASPDELQALLLTCGAAANTGAPVVIIVDGLDHISRVAAESPTVATADTSIVEELASLTWPPGVCLVFGSQPGDHLLPLESSSRVVQMPQMILEQVRGLADRMGLLTAMEPIAEDVESTLAVLAERAEGNPLYATMLIRGALAACAGGQLPIDHFNSSPQIDGEVGNYYQYLYDRLSHGQSVANALGVLDFAVTESELAEIVGPYVAPQLPQALTDLRPLLSDLVGQGGLRVFHESFRRFIVERGRNPQQTVRQFLEPVVTWLRTLGAFENSRAYRHLPVCLGRSGRLDELYALLSKEFVATSLAHGYSRLDIERTLNYGAALAAAAGRFTDLVTGAHLLRASLTCFEERFQQPEDYWCTFIRVNGTTDIADRLCPGGEPALDRGTGLRVCSAIDKLGGAAPWHAYFEMPSGDREDEDHYISASRPQEVGRNLAAQYRAFVRLFSEAEASERLVELLSREDFIPEEALLEPLFDTWIELDPAGPIAFLRGGGGPPKTRGVVASFSARRIGQHGDPEVLRELAEIAVSGAVDAEAAALCLQSGAACAIHPDWLRPSAADVAGRPGMDGEGEQAILAWFACVRLVARTAPDKMEALRGELKRPGWYWSWLTFLTWLADAEAANRREPAEASRLMMTGFSILTRDAHPGIGTPRAMDLYAVRSLIVETIATGLGLVSPAAFADAVAFLVRASSGTMASLQGSPMGPIESEALIEMLVPFAGAAPTRAAALAAAENARTTALADGQLYDVQARIDFQMACVFAAGGEDGQAKAIWRSATQFLASYGFRKDATIFDLVDSLPSLAAQPGLILTCLEKLNPLLAAVVAHTDGKGTRNAPNQALQRLAQHDPVAAIGVVSEELSGAEDATSWVSEQALRDAIRACHTDGHPLLVALAESTLRFQVDSGADATRRVKRVVDSVLALQRCTDQPASRWIAGHLAARVEGDPRECSGAAYDSVRAAAAAVGLPLPSSVFASRPGPKEELFLHPSGHRGQSETTPPPAGIGTIEVMAWIRKVAHVGAEEGDVDLIVNKVGWTCRRLADEGSVEAAFRLVRSVCRALPSFGNVAPLVLEGLGDGFERLGSPRLACLAYALAFTTTRGGGGWHAIGDGSAAHLVDKATAIDRELAQSIFAEEAARKAGDGYAMGLTQAIVWWLSRADLAAATAAWTAAFEVIAFRLPTVESRAGWLPRFRVQSRPDWDVDEALCAAIIGRSGHPECDRRASALLALAVTLQACPGKVGRPLRSALGTGPSPTRDLSVLQAVWEFERAPFQATLDAEEALRGLLSSGWYGVRVLAQALLVRAGVEVGPTIVPDPPAAPLGNHESIKTAARVVGSRRLTALESRWSDYPARVAGRFSQLAWSDEGRKRRRDRMMYMGDRDVDMERWTPVVQYEIELGHQALHEAANGIRPPVHALLREARLAHEVDVLQVLLPDLRTQMGVAASRVPRPPLSRVPGSHPGVSSPDLLGEDDAYAGWTRIALHEREYVWGEKTWLAEPESEWERWCGLHSTVSGRPVTDAPLRLPERSTWFAVQVPNRPWRTGGLPAGPLVGLSWMADPPLMHGTVLELPVELMHALGLRSATGAGPLRLLEDGGEVSARFRCWAIGSMRDGERPSRIQGCDLIVAPPIIDALRAMSRGALVTVNQTSRRSIPPTRPR